MSSLSYACGSTDAPLMGETIGQDLQQVVERFPDREALVDCAQGVRTTYAALWEQTSWVARGLLVRGIRRGDRVGVWAANRHEWVVVQFAAARIGAILVPMNPTYQAAELQYALNHSGTSLLLYAARFRDADCDAVVASVRGQCPALRQALSFEEGWAGLIADGQSASESELRHHERVLDLDDPITIQYTSGTTGRPKGATLSHHNLLNNAHLIGRAIGYDELARVCVPVPLFHCFGMVLGTLGASTHGATVVLPGGTFDPVQTLEAVQAEQCTSLYGVPTMYKAQLEHPRFHTFDLSSLRTGLIGGAPCPADLLARIRLDMHMPALSTVCGMTETSPISTQTCPDDPLLMRDVSVGRPTPHVEVKVIDPATGQMVSKGTPGEQCTRGYSVMLGYWDDEKATKKAIDRAGWLRTGDLAVMDAEGYLTIVGRLKDVIIRGGENIYPREVEDLLRTHPDVSDVHVIGVPDPHFGEQVMAWVQPRAHVELQPTDLLAFCTGVISRSKIPSIWKFTEHFPTTGSGKVQKFRMREIAMQELCLRRAHPSQVH